MPAPPPLTGDDGCGADYLRVKGEDSLLDKGTREAKKKALELAQLRAVEQTCRASVASERLHVSTGEVENNSNVLLVKAGGKPVETRNLRIRVLPPPLGADDALYARLEVEACVKVICDESSRRDPYFLLLGVQMTGSDGRAATSFADGDSLVLEVRPSKDAYFTILSLYARNDGVWVARRIYPNDVERVPRLVPANTAFRYPPSDKNDESSIGLTAMLPEGNDRSDEQLWVIATRKPWPPAIAVSGQKKVDAGGGGHMVTLDERGLDAWNRYVTDMPGSEITDQFVTFTIHHR
jgi:hypothetical protein